MRRGRRGERICYLQNSGTITFRCNEPRVGHELAGTRSYTFVRRLFSKISTFDSSSQGRFAGYRMGRDRSVDMRTIAAISRCTFSGSERIESRPVIYEAALCVTFEHRLIKGVHVTRAMHEPNGGYCSGEIKQARP